MLFSAQTPFFILPCGACKGVGESLWRACSECKGMRLGRMAGNQLQYFGRPLTRYHIALSGARRFLHRLQLVGAMIMTLGFFGLFAWQITAAPGLFDRAFTADFWLKGQNTVASLFWLGAISIGYLLYRAMRTDMPDPIVRSESKPGENTRKQEESAHWSWEEARKLPKKHRIDISRQWGKEAAFILESAYRISDRSGADSVRPEHVFFALLLNQKVKMIFIRLGISLRLLEAKAKHLIAPAQSKRVGTMPVINQDVAQIIFHARESALKSGADSVEVSDLLEATVRASEPVQELLYDASIDEKKLTHMIAWVKIRERLRRQYQSLRRAAAHHNKYGLDRAMTAVATPYLNSFSQDMTMQAASGYYSPCVAREMEMAELSRVIESGRSAILLVGEPGVGKMSIIEGLAERMVSGDVHKRLFDKRLVQISTSALLAGTTVSGAQQRLMQMVREVRHAGNIILFINNIHDLMSVRGTEGAGMDVSETLAEYLSGKNMLLLATTTKEGYSRFIINSEIGTVSTAVQIREMDEDQTIEVLESKAGSIEYKQQVFFAYDAVAAAAQLAGRFLRDQNLPESAIGLLTEAGSYVHNRRGDNQLVGNEDVAAVVAEKTGIPVASISQNESQKLLRLEDEMHKRVVGQDEAVSLVANALRRARAEIRSQKKPIANFLFLGPTGVGKTELAKTIADVYFGGEERMIRLDMSEFQDSASVYRLIGDPGKQGTGLLTEAVREHPFSLLLLDELEKANTNVLNVFLQVFDDGRLTDSVGRVIDFTNTIIIATSNAGTEFVQEQNRAGAPIEEIRQKLIRGELKQYYRPEFINRFDAVVLFKMLSYPDILQIAGRMLERVGADLEKRGVGLRVEPSALRSLAEVGFDPEFGARPMRRAIQDRVENKLAELILENKLNRRDTVVVGDGAEIKVESNS